MRFHADGAHFLETAEAAMRAEVSPSGAAQRTAKRPEAMGGNSGRLRVNDQRNCFNCFRAAMFQCDSYSKGRPGRSGDAVLYTRRS